MNLYLLKLKDSSGRYDIALGFVVRARSGRSARRFVADSTLETQGIGTRAKLQRACDGPGAEGAEVWLDPERTSCRLIHRDRPAHESIVLRDFKAG